MNRHLSLLVALLLPALACGEDRMLVGSGRLDGGAADTPAAGGGDGPVAATGGAIGAGGTTATAAGDVGHGGVARADAAAADVAAGGGLSTAGNTGTGGSGTGGLSGRGGGGTGGGPGLGGSNGTDASQDKRLDSGGQQETDADAAAREVGADGGGPLLCNGTLLLGGLPLAKIGGSPIATAAGDVNADGKLDLVTTSARSGLSVLLGLGDGSFSASVGYDLGGELWALGTSALALGDLDGDGNADIVATNAFMDRASVLLGKGDGTFADAVNYPTGDSPGSLALGDVNGDGHPDLVTANFWASSVSVLLGKGDGSFAASVGYPAGDWPGAVVIGDLDGEGAPDLVVANPNAKVVTVLYGRGDGSFITGAQFPTGVDVDSATVSAALGDLNGDAKLDLVLAIHQGQSNWVSVLLGKGDGTFATSINAQIGYGFTSSLVSLTDLNDDHKLDLICEVSGKVSVRLGQGDGTFAPGIDYSAGTGGDVVSGAAGDFDGDGVLDLAVTLSGATFGWVRVLLGTGGGAFSTTAEYPTEDYVNATALGDLNADGILDIATANSGPANGATVSVFAGRGDGTFAAKRDFATAGVPQSVSLGDLNGDGKMDMVSGCRDANLVSVLLNRGDGTFAAGRDYAIADGPTSLVLGDLDGDGKLDVVTANLYATGTSTYPPTSSVSVLLGQGDGTFSPRVDYATAALAVAVALGDLNGDGKPDVVVATDGGDYATQSVGVLLGKGDGTLAARVDYPSRSNLSSLVLGDLNGDGRLDIVWGDLSNTVGVLLGKGDGTFAPPVSYDIPDGAASLAVGDLNRDGKADLAATTNRTHSVCLLLGKGDGTFAATIEYAAASSSLALADLNADGKLEVVATSKDALFLLDLCQ